MGSNNKSSSIFILHVTLVTMERWTIIRLLKIPNIRGNVLFDISQKGGPKYCEKHFAVVLPCAY